MIASEENKARAWLCVQAGHRELYGIPRALQRVNALDGLITDLWVPPGSMLSRVVRTSWGRRMADRYSSDLPVRKVHAFPMRTLSWEACMRARRISGGRGVLERNEWWGSLVGNRLGRHVMPSTGAVFSYCYEARAVFGAARSLGLKTVLGQIDPGPEEDRKVAELVRRRNEYRTQFQPGSEAYYASWREECRLATHVLVNSAWSGGALEKAGVERAKIKIVPLVYAPPPESVGWSKQYPDAFTPARPLKVLFLGQCILRKGIAETIEAAKKLVGQPVEFILVGNTDIESLESHFPGARIRYYPRVSRAECHAFYREADVFLFPTHSDGFGLTQLEAQAWKLPIIASRFCAEVVEDRRTGWILPEVSAAAIESSIREILLSPSLIGRFSSQITPWRFDLAQLGRSLVSLGQQEVVS